MQISSPAVRNDKPRPSEISNKKAVTVSSDRY